MAVCTYCRRTLTPRADGGPLAHTRDHVVPRSKGGAKTVPACYVCNNIKGDMMPDEWIAYMAANPKWWEKVFRTKKLNPAPEPRNRIKAPPLEQTRAFLRAVSKHRPLKDGEAIPVVFEDTRTQKAFEKMYEGREYLLRVAADENERRMAEYLACAPDSTPEQG
jgi:hypothetical protein